MTALYYLSRFFGRIHRALSGGWYDGIYGQGLLNRPKEGE